MLLHMVYCAGSAGCGLVAVVGRYVVGCEHQRSTPYAVTHGLCSPEDGHNYTRNVLRQKLIINF